MPTEAELRELLSNTGYSTQSHPLRLWVSGAYEIAVVLARAGRYRDGSQDYGDGYYYWSATYIRDGAWYLEYARHYSAQQGVYNRLELLQGWGSLRLAMSVRAVLDP